MSGRSLLRLVAGLVVLGLAVGLSPVSLSQDGTTGLADSPWPKFKRDAQNTGNSPHPSIVDPFVKWTFPAPDGFRSSPVIAPDGTIYIGSGSLHALNPDGIERWSVVLSGHMNTGAPAIAGDGTIYVGSVDTEGTYLGKLQAISPQGTLKWTFDAGYAGDDSLSPALAPDGTIYVGTRSALLAVNPNGTLKWSHPTGGYVQVTPALCREGTVYVLASDAKLYAFKPDGSLRWTYATSAPRSANHYSTPSVAPDGTIYFGTVGDNRVWAVNPDGTLKWTFQANNWIRRSPTIAPDGTIYVGEDYGWYGAPQAGFKLYALHPDGTLKWSFEPYSAVGSAVSLASDGTLYFASVAKLYAVNPGGTLDWEQALGSAGVYGSVPAIDTDGTIYIGGYDKKLYAIGGEVRAITATIDVGPGTLHLKSKGKWVTAYIELPEGHDVSAISLASVAVTAVGGEPITPIYAEASPIAIGDYDGDSVPDLMVKVDRQVLQQQLSAGNVALEISGRLVSGVAFRGVDKVRVLH